MRKKLLLLFSVLFGVSYIGISIVASASDIIWSKPVNLFTPSHAGAGAYYPRLIILHNGDWLAAYDTNDGDDHTRCQISRSMDQGRTWKVLATASFGNGNAANAQMIQLNSGDILLAYRLVDGDHKQLKISRSRDDGATWSEWSIITEVSLSRQGVWEPHLGYLPDGKLAVMYASEAYQPDWPQVIEMKVSSDNGKTWSAPVRVSEKANSRDGMPVWTITKSGKVLAVFESSDDPQGTKPFMIRYKISSDGYHWPEERNMLYYPERNVSRAAAPFVISMPGGTIVASAQVDYNLDNPGCTNMHVMVSDDEGNSWNMQAGPFLKQVDNLWNSLLALPGNQILAATSTTQDGIPHILICIGKLKSKEP
ncbi:MAG TPA: sialidase family protein [Bacillota bacterium]